MKLIPLTQGKFAKVDDEDFEWLSQWKWYFTGYYAAREERGKDGKQRAIRMHRVIADTPPELEVDHINGDKLDNRRVNLRNCVHYQNNFHQGMKKHNTSGYKGIIQINSEKWVAKINVKGKQIYLGSYDDPKDAAKAYDIGAKQYHGEFASLNFPEE